ncbi:N-acylneuraminate cytidylyltransferase [Nonlabens xylanidelens]|uniref:N-acylneuraminate cytidylyltransferase n=1 Tax=Nonlabens xylanidelens TaxID=191564 RepID=A0A2S6ILK0_9FLAO|nr:acylneuraminate cytidylyltransferase family protein [Nonlabens xylanidelens]PPK95099.1 N-acylneuraminate cytidylyltransferase [Nonlabens xylanidelens]PQJ17628.1 acylneuraminate cytidylyltransferase [Nonlabens xylanidelens]
MQLTNLVIIPARGGSKRLPGKNLKELDGIPLIQHSIQYALLAGSLIDKIVVTTDSNDIAQVAMDCGVEVIKRPTELSGDHEPVISAMQHTLESLSGSYENVILLQPTNPLRPKNLLKESLESFESSKVDSLMTVDFLKEKFGKIVGDKFVPENYIMGQRSQDLPQLYRENGLLYITKVSEILEGNILAEHNFAMVVDHPFSRVDIDDITDFKFAELMLEMHAS